MPNNLNYSELIEYNNKKIKTISSKKNLIKVKIFSNISCFQLKEYLYYDLFQNNFGSKINIAEHDNFFDFKKNENNDFLIVFWELSNLIEGSQFKLNSLSQKELREFIINVKRKIELFLNQSTKNSIVIFNKFSSANFSRNYFQNDNFKKVEIELNTFLDKKKIKNLILVDLNQLISELGTNNSISLRDFYISKSMYTLNFYRKYSSIVSNIICSKSGLIKKVLVLDCDNTLWKGILIEDGINKIQMEEHSFPGSIFFEVQNLIFDLYKKGILICLNTKNNYSDIKNVFKKKTFLKLKNFAEVQSNWNDKVSNMKKISQNLNLGLESFVFLDDSDFEINHVKKMLPEVTCLKVPNKNLFEYPSLIRNLSNIFFPNPLTKEDKYKNYYYERDKIRKENLSKFKNLNDYINSLNISVKVKRNDIKSIERVTQLTQKTNQFNSSLKRYSQNQISKLLRKKTNNIFTGVVSDKYGSTGLTLVCITKKNKRTLFISDFIMSCRIFGRKIEYAFLNYLENKLITNEINCLKIEFKKGPKNYLVEEFLKKYGFVILLKNKNSTVFEKRKSNKLNAGLKDLDISCNYER